MTPARSLDPIVRQTAQTEQFKEVVARLRRGERQVLLHTLPTALAAFLLTWVQRSLSRPLLVVAAGEERAEEWRDNLEALAGAEVVRYFPAWDMGLYDQRSPAGDIAAQRLEAAAQLRGGAPTIAVAPAAALLAPLIPPRALERSTLHLRAGEERDLEQLSAHLVDCGFERVALVDGAGQFSVRGGILDVYPFGVEQPLRLEFSGDGIESIRSFDLQTQRSRAGLQEAAILPAREVVLIPPFYDEFLARLERLEKEEGLELDPVRESLELGASLEGIEVFMALLYGRDQGLFEYVQNPVVFCEEAEDLERAAARMLDPARKEYERLHGPGPAPGSLLRDAAWLEETLSACVHLRPAPLGQSGQALSFEAREPRVFQGELPLLRRELEQLGAQNYAIHILCETQGQSLRLQEIFAEWSGRIAFGLGTLHRGFVYPAARIALLNDHEIFSHQKRRHRYRCFKAAAPIAHFKTLHRGDFVVHVDHGIGRYLGIRRLRLAGREHDCLEVSYAGGDKVFVPVEQLDRLRRYSSAEAEPPLLNKLGTGAWERLKERTRKEIFKMAGELIRLYAERKARPGFRFAPDAPLMRELEASFPFQETPDQLRTAEEVKKDMEAPQPMDRLVCGDVGYGKTEIAVRAAFKAVCDGKQVAVLVPTTILAQQHYHTFCERMAHLPVEIEVLSRFRSAREQQEILRRTRVGAVDILIGTHRLLSRDLEFRDLGVLVIDEEQRFGVRHKEKLKQLKRQVDVLALTATPIPRTLHMSLLGSRDMSVINTPPQDRLPIHTEILAFDEGRIVEAISREVARGGQVYFVHNRVQSIHRLTEYLEELLPQVRFGVAHGQMPSRQLERIMFEFLERKYDCLVCTMIIESGIDIPSVNTILVNRADLLGLAQLYQIRGRVGRSRERACAYLLVPKGKRLKAKSRLRLRAIEEFAELGSGFNIAMRDMEIRGTGNLLGPQQHGFITAVGFDLYCRLLDEAMRELKGERVVEQPDPEIKIAVTAYIPEAYIPAIDQKMEFYQRLADAPRCVDLLSIREEMEDRFGRLPFQAQALLCLTEIKVMARQLGLAGVRLEGARLRLSFPPQRRLSPLEVREMVQKSSLRLEFQLDQRLVVQVHLGGRDELERLEKARNLLRELL